MHLSLSEAFALMVACTLYTHRIARMASGPGCTRMLACVPAMATCTFLPILCWNEWETLTAKMLYLAILGWWSNFKLLAYCCGRGPLDATKNTLTFAAVLWLPTNLPSDEAERVETKRGDGKERMEPMLASRLLRNGILKGSILYGLLYLADLEVFPPSTMFLVYALMLYTFLGTMLDSIALFGIWVGGLKVIPHFDRPYLSTSLSDFWARRWNMMTAGLLKMVVYAPLVEGRLVRRPGMGPCVASRHRIALAICATFMVSGLMHEILYYVGTGKTRLEWFAFFTSQGPLVLLERYWRDKKDPKMGRCTWMSSVSTIGFLLFMGIPLFFLPAVRDGLVGTVQQELASFLHV